MLLVVQAHLIKENDIPLKGSICISCIPASSPCTRGRGSQVGSVVLEHAIGGEQDSFAMHDPLQCVIPADTTIKVNMQKFFMCHFRSNHRQGNLAAF